MADAKYIDYYGQSTDSYEEAQKGTKRNAEDLKRALAEGKPVGVDYFGQPTTDQRQIQRGIERNTRDAEREKTSGKSSKEYKKGGKVSNASSRGDGIAQRGKTKGRMY
jgi:hypothetical protein